MRTICKARGGGKTTTLFEQAIQYINDGNEVIFICGNFHIKQYTQNEFIKYWEKFFPRCEIRQIEFYSYNEVFGECSKLRGKDKSNIRILIDNGDLILQALLGNTINIITVSDFS